MSKLPVDTYIYALIYDLFNCVRIDFSFADEIAAVHKQYPAEPFQFLEPR